MFDFSIPETTHRIIINSALTKQKDLKSFSINTKESCEQISVLLEEFITKNKDRLFPENITYGNEPKNTHRIIVQPTIIDEENSSKSFSVKLPSYSSYEIANEIHKYLCGGKTLS